MLLCHVFVLQETKRNKQQQKIRYEKTRRKNYLTLVVHIGDTRKGRQFSSNRGRKDAAFFLSNSGKFWSSNTCQRSTFKGLLLWIFWKHFSFIVSNGARIMEGTKRAQVALIHDPQRLIKSRRFETVYYISQLF